MLSFLKKLFKPREVIPFDPALLEIYNSHKNLPTLFLDIKKYQATEHPWFIQDDIYTSWAGKSKRFDGKSVKFLPKMGGAKFTTRPLEIGDAMILATINFAKNEGVYWLGIVKEKSADRLIVSRFKYFCNRR
jgi:hypothetical protein